MRNLAVAVACAALAGGVGLTIHVRAAQTESAATFDSGRAYEYLRQLVAYGPRPSGSMALAQTRAYITGELKKAGLPVGEQSFTATLPIGPTQMVNLVVRLPGRRSDRILFTGHYDTKRSPNFAFVGASDGASSAALLMELALALHGRPHEYTYEFVWFDGEEATCWDWDQCSRPGAPDNLYGSRHYVQAGRNDGTLASIKAMILVDMIGARDLKVLRETQYSAAWLTEIIWATAKKLGDGATFLDTPYPVDDDHVPFVEAGVACVDIIDLRDYPEWHTAQDDLAHVGAASLGIVGNVLVASAPAIEQYLAK